MGVQVVAVREWGPDLSGLVASPFADLLEEGGVLYLPELPFEVAPDEKRFLSPTWLDGSSKSVYLKGQDRRLRGTRAVGAEREALQAMVERFGSCSQALVRALFPAYVGSLKLANTSFRPCEAEGRRQSWRHDDTRLHTDAFPSQPLQGQRILRVFSNANPEGRSRNWRIGEPFGTMAERFLPRVGRPLPGKHWLMEKLGVTKAYRTEYDHIMLRLHDLQKADLRYQYASPQERFEFPPGTTWICFSDQVLHAVMAGQHLFEQTFSLPAEAQVRPERSPLRVLETLTGRRLAA